MKPEPQSPLKVKLSASQRRDALLADCALQRTALGLETRQLFEPLSGGNVRQAILARLKVPLMVAGGVLGLMLLRPRRSLPWLLRAASLLRHASVALPVMRSMLQRMNRQQAPVEK